MNEKPDSKNAGSDSPTTVATWDAFLSYSHKDTDIAERVEAALEREGIKVWRDKEEIIPGDNFVKKIGEGLAGSHTFIFLISPAAADSKWIDQEYTTAVALSNEPTPVVIIPVLIKDARDEHVPTLLMTKQRVDLSDESKFTDGINELIQGIKREPTTILRTPEASKAHLSFIPQISFLGFFPEGLLTPAFNCLVSHLNLQEAVANARKAEVVLATEIEGIEMIIAAAGMIRTLFDHMANKQTLARETLSTIERWIADTHLFDPPRKRLGVGRSLLVRDLLVIAGHLSDDDAKDSELRDQASAYARKLLPKIIEENLRIAAEISKSLMETTGVTSADYLMHARLLLGLGFAEQALEIFDSYGSDDLFVEAGLDPETRVFVIQDWAKAVKDSGRANKMHQQLVQAYKQVLVDVNAMAVDGDTKRLNELTADIRNDRATQFAAYGNDSDWAEAQADFKDAAGTYRDLGLNGKLLASRANFVSHSLDRFKRSGETPPNSKLQELLPALDSLDHIANASEPDEDLFFFFYQKARLLKRLYPNEQKRAIRCYQLAADIAGPGPSPFQPPRIPHRFPIARRWVLKLSHQALLISEEEYLRGLRKCSDLLKQNSEDAWAAHALYATLLDVTMILRARVGKDDLRNTWNAAKESFGVAAGLFRRSGSPTARRRLFEILKLMSELNPGADLQASFLQEKLTNELLVPLVNAPAFRQVNWEDIHDWLTVQEE